MNNLLPKALFIAALLLLPVVSRTPALAQEEQAANHEHYREHYRQTARVGRPAPDFSLDGVVSTEPDKEFQKISLGDYKGKWLVLFFYPADFTFVCPTEIRGFNTELDAFKKRGAEIVGISTDSKYSHLAWLDRGDLGELHYPLLADFTKETAREYGVLDEETGVALRGLFIIDPKGIIQYQVVQNLEVGRSVDEVLRVLDGLKTGSLCPLNWQPGEKTLGE
jgi:alkyl hydroperoxide reductase subunit AhpC